MGWSEIGDGEIKNDKAWEAKCDDFAESTFPLPCNDYTTHGNYASCPTRQAFK
jgi:hypothetical protein